jgi:hypothetical protein
MANPTQFEYDINGTRYTVDLAEVDRLVAEITAGPGENIGENIFDTFANCAIIELGDPQEFIADNAGVKPPPTIADIPPSASTTVNIEDDEL